MKHRFLFPAAVALSATLLVANAEDAKKGATVFIDPAKAKADDPDFADQGEYVGKADNMDWGIQLIALGDGKFDFVAYPGGLPGAGWDGKKENRLQGSGVRRPTGDIIIASKTNAGSKGVVKDGEVKLYAGDAKKPFGEFKRTERKSPTLGKKAPEGAIILFDGSNSDAWKGKGGKTDGLMDGELLSQGVTSKETFQDFHLHMEFRTPYKPKARGQGRGNSGFYAQGRYEVQILDSFGLEGEQNECGGIYSVGKPLVNMCYPPLSWQTYDVDFTAARYDDEGKKTKDARLTVKHNGVLIHDDIVADHSTTASPLKEGPENGPIFLQDHGNPVRFRNVWLVKK